jgi:HAMP domain-containing protein
VSDKLVERLRSRRKWDSARGMERAESPFPYLEEEAADRIEELEAQVKWMTGEKASIAGWPWDSPYMDGYEVAKEEYRDRIEALERALEWMLDVFCNDPRWNDTPVVANARGLLTPSDEPERQ